MYADRHASPHRLNPVSIALAIAINGAVMGALVFSAPIVEKIAANGPFILYPVKEPPTPEPIPTPEPRANAAPMPDQSEARPVGKEGGRTWRHRGPQTP